MTFGWVETIIILVMKHPNLKQIFPKLQNTPLYKEVSNQLTRERAQEIAKLFFDDLMDLEEDFKYANSLTTEAQKRPDSAGNGLGKFLNAERLFFGYVYDRHYQGACESEEDARRHEYDE